MTSNLPTAKTCVHLQVTETSSERLPLEIDYVFDANLHPTDGLAHCVHCHRFYLFEMRDTHAGPPLQSLFQVAAVQTSAARRVIRSLRQGSCDLARGRQEVAALSMHAQPLDQGLLMRDGQFVALSVRPPGPHVSWRDLPCDGALLDSVLLDDALLDNALLDDARARQTLETRD